MIPADPLNATLVGRIDLNEELSVFRIRPDGGVPTFHAGQFATLGLPRPAAEAPAPAAAPVKPPDPAKPERVRLTRRAYSIASAPDNKEYLEFLIVLIRAGRLTPALWALPVGGRLFCDSEIKGEFTLEGVPDTASLVMISTGTGSAPFVAMVRAAGAEPAWRRCVFINGVRHSRDLGYRDELEQRAAGNPRFVYVPLVSRPADDPHWHGRTGRVNSVLEPDAFERLAHQPLTAPDTHVFLCGNPQMIEQTTQYLQTLGFTTHSRKNPGNIHFERYW